MPNESHAADCPDPATLAIVAAWCDLLPYVTWGRTGRYRHDPAGERAAWERPGAAINEKERTDV